MQEGINQNMGRDRCSLSGVHNRLNEVHKFWHDMLFGYQNPENFHISLNAAIQALRNVTFLLQSNKSNIPDFDQWYEKYRNIMKSDEILKWLHQAAAENSVRPSEGVAGGGVRGRKPATPEQKMEAAPAALLVRA